MTRFVAAIDQGTTSTRCLLFDRRAEIAGSTQKEHRQILPRPGWVEHDPLEIWAATQEVVRGALADAGATAGDLAAVGITNQRETVVIWDPESGQPLCNAIVWQDTRTEEICAELAREGGRDRFRARTGLPLATYFSAPKVRWALEHVDGLAGAADAGRALCGTIDSWLIWNLTGGADGGRHVTDVTNASRTLLLDLRSLDWDAGIAREIGVPTSMLPAVVSSSDPAGWGATRADGPFGGEVPVCGALGDQQAALMGQACFEPGTGKNTYGTGCFLLLNTGEEPVFSEHGLLTTVGYRLGDAPPAYALEGSIAYAGALVQWLRDNLGIISSASEIEELAGSVEDSGGVVVVPAFSGLFAPRWRPDARGVIAGLTGYATRAHLARAALESTCYQTREVLEAMLRDAPLEIERIQVDGGMTVNDLLMQIQADVLGLEVERAALPETTALGAAFAAGLAVGFWPDLAALSDLRRTGDSFRPRIDEAERERGWRLWNRAVERSLDWVD